MKSQWWLRVLISEFTDVNGDDDDGIGGGVGDFNNN